MHFCCFLMNFETIYRYFPHPQTNNMSLTWKSKLYWLCFNIMDWYLAFDWLWFNIIDWYLAFVPKMSFLSRCFNLDVSNDIYLYEVCVLLCICHIYDIYYIIILQTNPYVTILTLLFTSFYQIPHFWQHSSSKITPMKYGINTNINSFGKA